MTCLLGLSPSVRTCLVGAVAGLLATATPASASQVMEADNASERGCEARQLDGAGADLVRWTAPAAGTITARLAGDSRSDWDLALFRGGEAIATSTSFTSVESATGLVGAGDRIAIQACRLSGAKDRIRLRTDFYELDGRPAPSPRISLESVTIEDGGDLARLERLGFDVTHDTGAASATVVTYSSAERRRLAEAGFDFLPKVRDLAAADAAARRTEDAAPASASRALPSGRTEYRTYAEFTSEMKALAIDNPGLVRSIEIGKTFEGRPIEGVEIAANVNDTSDGRPVYLNFGAHHAREWPSAELPMEFALDLVASQRAGDPRVVSLLERVRVIIVPIVNVDGFIASRSFGTNPLTDDNSDATLALAVGNQAAYIRKNCRPTAPGDAAKPCATRTGSGVDLNRNYGAYWGGPGSSTNITAQGYRGTKPFSEPESEAVHQFTAGIQPTVFITNHSFTEDGKWLRQPGFDADFLPQMQVPTYSESCAKNPEAADDDPGALSPDEVGMKSLGDAMAAPTGWTSELGYETLCDITGATEDWNYYSQGTYGYTPEARGPNFHANYAQMVVAEYGEGTSGVGEAYLVAGERAADPAEHSVIEGPAPPGAILTLRKAFDTPTCESAACPRGNGPAFKDVLETRLTVPADGTYEWHTNPSGRPLHPNEVWTMSCQVPGGATVSREVAVARGTRVTENFSGCGPSSGDAGGGGAGGGSGSGGGGGGGSGSGGGGGPRCGGRVATVSGTAAPETFKGTPDVDVIVGAGAGDRIQAAKGDDVVCGRAGKDTIIGGGGDDRLRGGDAKDLIRGGPGEDRCRGGRAKDRLKSCE